MEQFVELIEMLGDAFLPVQSNKLGKRVRKLFNYLRISERPTEEDAARKIGVIPGSADFRKVKHHLKLALINGVVAIDSRTKDMPRNRKEMNHKVWNYVSVGQSDLGPVKEFIATDLIGNVVEPARHFDLQEPLLVAHLSLIDSEVANSMGKKNYLELCQQVHTEIDFDYKLQIGHKHLAHSNFLNIRRASNAEKVSYLGQAVAEINGISAENRFRTMHASLYLGLKLRFAKRDYESAIDFIENALPQYDPTNTRQRPMVRVFQNNLLRAFLYTCRYEEGIEFGCDLLEKETSLKVTHYASQELTMMLALRSGNYQVAYRIYKEVVDAKVVDSLNHNYKETFLIIEAYLHLLIGFRLIDIGEEGVGDMKLKIGRFINDMSFSSKEKKRRNIHVIIIKLVHHYLNRKNTDFDMADAIRKYVQRHLSDSKTIRAKNFILALVLFSENGFNRRLVEQEVGKYIVELNRHAVGQNDQDPFGELVAYESLWSHLINSPNR